MIPIIEETKARRRWCPFVQVASGRTNEPVTNRNVDVKNCIASDCMAWRTSAHKPADGSAPAGWCGRVGEGGPS